MIGTCLALTTAVLLVAIFAAMEELAFLQPYRDQLFGRHGTFIALYLLLFGINVFSALFLVHWKLGLRSSGKKLRQLEHEGVLAQELAEQIPEE